jgi:hypothetical protein
MKKNPLYYFTIIALLYVVGAVFNGQAIYNQSKLYAKDKLDYVDVLNFEDRLLNIDEWIFTGSGWDDKDLISKEKLKSSEMDYAVEKKYSYCFIAGSTAFIVIVLIIFWGGNNLYKAVGASSHYYCPDLPDNWSNHPDAGDQCIQHKPHYSIEIFCAFDWGDCYA